MVSADLQVIGVDPVGSILAEPPELNEGGVGMYQVRRKSTIVYAYYNLLYCILYSIL